MSETWQQIVIGGYREEDFLRLPADNLAEIQKLTVAAQDRAHRRSLSQTIPEEELDTVGLAENKLRVPHIILAIKDLALEQIAALVREFFLQNIDEFLEPLSHKLHALQLDGILKDRLAIELALLGLINTQVHSMRTAAHELITNAVLHGIIADIRKKVFVGRRLLDDVFYLRIEDQGLGFRRDELPPEPADGPDLRDHGRGIGMAVAFMDEVQYEGIGNIVVASCNLRQKLIDAIENTTVEILLKHALLDE